MLPDQTSLIFLHIPKAAGTTLNQILARQYQPESIYSIDGTNVQESIAEFKQLSESEKRKIRLIKGHMNFGLHEFFPQPTAYLTILREPVSRVISNYYYVLKNPKHYLHATVQSQKMSLKDYICSGLALQANNGQVRLLSGRGGQADNSVAFGACTSEMLEKAKQNLRQYFPVVGLTEKFDETLILLKHKFGWKNIFYKQSNVNKNRPASQEISQDVVSIINYYNQLDQELYKEAQKIFQEQVNQQSYDFDQKLNQFKKFNQKYGNLLANTVEVVNKTKKSLISSIKF